MISNSIDGSSSNQVLDLLSILSGSPEVYANKLKALQDATAEHQKFVEAVGPAGDIIGLRNQAIVDRDAAKQELSAAKVEAKALVAQAKADAQSTVDAANSKAEAIISEADTQKLTADVLLTKAQQANAAAIKAQAKADGDTAAAQAKSLELDKAITNANLAKAEADATKADIVAKHKAFIESL
jgi:cell division septum initiation protein DivIVA